MRVTQESRRNQAHTLAVAASRRPHARSSPTVINSACLMSSIADESTDESLSRLVEERSRELQLLRAVAAVQKGEKERIIRSLTCGTETTLSAQAAPRWSANFNHCSEVATSPARAPVAAPQMLRRTVRHGPFRSRRG